MLFISGAVLLGCLALVFIYLHAKSKIGLIEEEDRKDIERKEVIIRRKDADLDHTVAERISEKEPLDEVIKDYQDSRSKLLAVTGDERQTWDWGQEELTGWVKKEIQKRKEAAIRRVLPRAVFMSIGLIAIIIVSVLAFYGYESSRNNSVPVINNTTAQPITAPLPISPTNDNQNNTSNPNNNGVNDIRNIQNPTK